MSVVDWRAGLTPIGPVRNSYTHDLGAQCSGARRTRHVWLSTRGCFLT